MFALSVKRAIMFAFAFACFLNFSFAYAAMPDTYSNDFKSQKGDVIFIPQGVKTTAILSQELNSKSATKGMNIYLTLDKDFVYKDKKIAPAGSSVIGTVVDCKKADKADGQLKIRFTNISTPQGYSIPITASVFTSDKTGVLKGSLMLDNDSQAKQDERVKSFTDVLLPTNSQIEIIFDQPVTLSAPRGY